MQPPACLLACLLFSWAGGRSVDCSVARSVGRSVCHQSYRPYIFMCSSMSSQSLSSVILLGTFDRKETTQHQRRRRDYMRTKMDLNKIENIVIRRRINKVKLFAGNDDNGTHRHTNAQKSPKTIYIYDACMPPPSRESICGL